VGYTTPREFKELVEGLRANVPGIGGVTISVHGHDDLGMAVANFMAAIEGGARQVECTINGIGERAGNAALEEIVMALHVRKSFYNRCFARAPNDERALTNIVTVRCVLWRPDEKHLVCCCAVHKTPRRFIFCDLFYFFCRRKFTSRAVWCQP
jgi:2-isopropylmalate synthase